MKDAKTVIEFGTSKIACATAIPKNRSGFEVIGYVKNEYAGIKNGNWVEPSSVGNCLNDTITELEKQTGAKIKTVEMALPATFSDLHMETVSMGIHGNVNASELDSLFSMASQFPRGDSLKVVNQFSAWYMLEDGEIFIDAYGKRTSNITAGIISVLTNKYLIQDLKILTRNAGVYVQSIICEQLAEALALIPEEKRDLIAILIDAGYYSTSISLVYGDAVLNTVTIDVGGGYVTDDIAYYMKMDKQTAERLKRQYSFGLEENNDINYLFAKTADGNLSRYPYDMLKKIIDSRMEHMVKQIMLTVKELEKSVGKQLTIYMTGGGFNYMPGINSFFQAYCGRSPIQCRAANTKLAEPASQSMYALLEYAMNSNDDGAFFEDEVEEKGFFSKISKKFFK